MTGIEEGHWWNYKYLNIQGYCIGREKGKHIMREREKYIQLASRLIELDWNIYIIKTIEKKKWFDI